MRSFNDTYLLAEEISILRTDILEFCQLTLKNTLCYPLNSYNPLAFASSKTVVPVIRMDVGGIQPIIDEGCLNPLEASSSPSVV